MYSFHRIFLQSLNNKYLLHFPNDFATQNFYPQPEKCFLPYHKFWCDSIGKFLDFLFLLQLFFQKILLSYYRSAHFLCASFSVSSPVISRNLMHTLLFFDPTIPDWFERFCFPFSALLQCDLRNDRCTHFSARYTPLHLRFANEIQQVVSILLQASYFQYLLSLIFFHKLDRSYPFSLPLQ